MVSLSIDSLFESAAKIFLFEDKAITVTFSQEGILIRFPTTRRLAEYMEVPHYYILPYFAMMEEQDLITRAERVGVLTTRKGTVRFIAYMKDTYAPEIQAILGENIFHEMNKMIG